jgi:hypothetical protein
MSKPSNKSNIFGNQNGRSANIKKSPSFQNVPNNARSSNMNSTQAQKVSNVFGSKSSAFGKSNNESSFPKQENQQRNHGFEGKEVKNMAKQENINLDLEEDKQEICTRLRFLIIWDIFKEKLKFLKT